MLSPIKITLKKNINVLRHMLGFFKKYLTAFEKPNNRSGDGDDGNQAFKY
jgi:uncharacterized protein YbgA (DUF1722 family)